jgi:hypothetical protein
MKIDERLHPARLEIDLSGREKPRYGIARLGRFAGLVFGGTVLAILVGVRVGMLPRVVQTALVPGVYWLLAAGSAYSFVAVPRTEVRMWGMPLRWVMGGPAAAWLVLAVMETREAIG